MPKSILDTTVSVACRSLVLVEEGWSERGALRRAAKDLDATDRREAFRLVMDTLSRKSLVDRIVGIALGQIPKNLTNRNVARLAVVCMLQTDRSERQGALEALRRNCADSFRPHLEKLVGDLLAHGTSEQYLSGTAEDEQLALRLGFPDWWISYCLRIWGRHEALHLLENRGVRPRYLHVNSLRVKNITGIQPSSLPGLEPVPSMPGFFRVLTEGLPGTVREYVETGALEGQDLAAYLAVKAGEPRGNDSVLDVCAAPGGKTGALSQLMDNKGSIVAVDYSLGRMRDWKRMTSTLGVTNASCIVEDATRAGLRLSQIFDLILVDPPCSGSGIFDKNPAMKWHMTPQRLARYGELQYKLLDQSSKFLKPGGRIVYSTCSISIEENEDVVSRFLSGNPDFQTRPTLKDWGHPGLKGYDNCRRFYPYLDGTSGYFIARLERFE